MRHSRARFSGSVASRRMRFLADCITATRESEFSVHTGLKNLAAASEHLIGRECLHNHGRSLVRLPRTRQSFFTDAVKRPCNEPVDVYISQESPVVIGHRDSRAR